MYDYYPYICEEIGSATDRLSVRIKRESGENPEQSRCCEAPINILKYLVATGLLTGKASRWESVRRPAVAHVCCFNSWD
jgi:hypothetical protein